MRITQKKSTKKYAIVLIIAIVLITSISAAWYIWLSPSDKSVSRDKQEINLDKPTDEETKAGNSIKERSLNEQAAQESSKASEEAAQNQNSNTDKTTVDAEITALNKTSESLQVRAFIDPIVTDGQCRLTMTGPNAATYTATAKVQALPNGTTCAGFNVPLQGLVSGIWKVSVEFDTPSAYAIAAKEVAL